MVRERQSGSKKQVIPLREDRSFYGIIENSILDTGIARVCGGRHTILCASPSDAICIIHRAISSASSYGR